MELNDGNLKKEGTSNTIPFAVRYLEKYLPALLVSMTIHSSVGRGHKLHNCSHTYLGPLNEGTPSRLSVLR